MKFERARSKENKQIRLNQIKKVAIEQFDSQPYHKISLSGIGKTVGFDRTNLYKYVRSKEEIYLYVLMDELKSYADDLEESFSVKSPSDVEDGAELLSQVLLRHRLFMKLNSILYSIIEKNSNVSLLKEFNQWAGIQYFKIRKIYGYFLPGKNEEEVERFMTHFHSFLIGAYPTSDPGQNQIKAIEGIDIPNKYFDLKSEVIHFVITYVKGSM